MTTATRCKKHFSDVSSTVGVCASCLRERLLSVMASQAQVHALARSRDHDPTFPDDSVATHPPDPPPPLVFPRSVSPYVARRHGNDDRFYRTPQVQKAVPNAGDTFSMPDSRHGGGRNGRWSRKLSFWQHLVFRSRSNRVDLETDHNRVSSSFDHESPESTPSLLSHLKGRWKNRLPRQGKNTSYMVDESSHGRSGWTVQPTPDRGFLPEYSEGEYCRGYSSERATPASVRGKGNGRGYPTEVVGMRFCLSPLIRTRPDGRRRPSSEVGHSIDVRVPATTKSGRRWGSNNCDR